MRDYKTASGMANGYAWILDERQAQIRDALSTLAAPGKLPAVFFCAGGTDRTGIVAAFLLGLAEVPDKTIAQDYHLSAQALVDQWRNLSGPISCQKRTLHRARCWNDWPGSIRCASLEYLNGAHGGVREYVKSIRLTEGQIARLRDALSA